MNLEKTRAKWDLIAKVGLVGLIGFVVAPIIFTAITGIIGLAVAAGISLMVVQFIPVVSMKVANWKVKGIVEEAKENPIETMINLLAAKREAYKEFKAAVETAVTARSDFALKCKQFASQYPHRADEFNKQLEAMTVLVERKKTALIEAKRMLELGDAKLDEMRAYWEMSKAAQTANAAAGMDTGDMYEKLKADTAVDSVFESVNRAFAQLEVAASLDSAPALENSPTNGIVIDDISVGTKIKV